MEENQTTPEPITEVLTDEQPKIIEAISPDKASKLQTLLCNLQTGWKVSLYREKPAWCRGHLETFDVYDTTEPIDIDGLVKRWGGQALHLKIHDEKGQWVAGGTIPLYSYEPRRAGVILTEEQFYAPSSQPGTALAALSPTPQQPQHTNGGIGGLGALGIDLPGLLKLLQGSSKAENSLVIRILERQLSQPAAPPPQQYAPPPPQQNPLDLMKQMMEMQMMLKEFSGMSGAEGGGGDGDGLTNMLGNLAQTMMQPRPKYVPETKKRRSRRMRRPQVAVSPPPSVPTPPPTRSPEPEQEPLRSVNTDDVDDLDVMAKHLARLSVNDSSDVVIEAWGRMPEEKRAAAMKGTFAKLQELQASQVDDSSSTEDTYRQDEDDYDDEPEVPDQNYSPQD